MTRNGIEAYTVKELKEVFDKLIAEGLGDRIVLCPDYDIDFPAEYRTIGSVDTCDATEECVYLEILTDEEEETFWGRK